MKVQGWRNKQGVAVKLFLYIPAEAIKVFGLKPGDTLDYEVLKDEGIIQLKLIRVLDEEGWD